MYSIDFLKEASYIKQDIIENRRYFHQYPEIGFEEFNTSKKIVQYLNELGIENKVVCSTGIVGIIRGNGDGPVVALRSDLDALPLCDRKDVEYSSKIEGKMHACGHDGHMAILMGAVKILNKHRDKFKGSVKIIFEPAEETVGGAKFMIEENVLGNPKVDAIIGLHVSELLEVGTVGVNYDVVNASSNPFKIVVKGKGGHGAHPEDSIDPIVASCNLVTMIQNVVSREISPHNPSVITVGKFWGGSAPNIIPEEVVLEGIIRTLNKQDRSYVVNRLKGICNGISVSMKVNIDVEIIDGYPCLFNDRNVVSISEKVFEEILGKENVFKNISPSMGVESFAYFSEKVPSMFYFLGTGNSKKGIVNPAHGSLFDLDEDGLVIGAALQSALAVNYLNKN